MTVFSMERGGKGRLPFSLQNRKRSKTPETTDDNSSAASTVSSSELVGCDDSHLRLLLETECWTGLPENEDVYVKYQWESPRSRSRTSIAKGELSEKVKPSMYVFRDETDVRDNEKDTSGLLSGDFASSSPPENVPSVSLDDTKWRLKNQNTGLAQRLGWLSTMSSGDTDGRKNTAVVSLSHEDDVTGLMDDWNSFEARRQLAFDVDSFHADEEFPPWILDFEDQLPPPPIFRNPVPPVGIVSPKPVSSSTVSTKRSKKYYMAHNVVRRKKKQPRSPWSKAYASARDFTPKLSTVEELSCCEESSSKQGNVSWGNDETENDIPSLQRATALVTSERKEHPGVSKKENNSSNINNNKALMPRLVSLLSRGSRSQGADKLDYEEMEDLVDDETD